MKLSAQWSRRLEAASTGGSFTSCAASPSSPECVAAMTNSVTTLTGVLRAISAADATAEYSSTLTEINGLVKTAGHYQSAGCPTDTSGDVAGACFKDAMDISVGMSRVDRDMVMDEQAAGVS